jgi:hypothetical protein
MQVQTNLKQNINKMQDRSETKCKFKMQDIAETKCKQDVKQTWNKIQTKSKVDLKHDLNKM